MSTITIAAAADENYALPLAVMLRSALGHLAPGTKAELHVVDDEIDPATRSKIAASLPVSVNWITRPRDEFKRLPHWGRMSTTTYHKLTLARWLPPPVERVLWLDGDMLVRADLEPLWQVDLAQHVLCAAQDFLVPSVGSPFGVAGFRELGLPAQRPYFNAGLMLIDLPLWRREEVEQRALAYLERFSQRVYFWDQEALNAVLCGRWKRMESRWNWTPAAERQAGADEKFAPAVVHFTGALKPWLYGGPGRYQEEYRDWLDQTAWRGTRPPGTLRHRALAFYESWRFRRYLAPLERLHLRFVRWWSRRTPRR